ncbi:MAG: hypothetical protein J0L66_10670 [Cytophagales bacterium]|nr:hypothetical protein [Cytophagales bacterium]
MKVLAAFLVAFLFNSNSFAQLRTDSIIIKTTPIPIKGGRYYFDSERTTFDGVGLLLNSLNDKIIDKRIRQVHLLKDFRKIIHISILTYGLIMLQDQQPSLSRSKMAGNLIIGASLTLIPLALIGKTLESQAIQRYNQLILKPQAMIDQERGILIGLTYKF